MFIDTDKYLEILGKTGLTADEFLLCYLIHLNRMDLIYRYVDEVRPFRKEEVERLIEKGYIFDNNPYRDTRPARYPEHYIATSTFSEIVFINTGEAFDELWEAYPVWLTFDDGKKVPGRSGDSLELEKVYAQLIRNNVLKHREVMEMLEYAKKNKLITMGIEKWIKSRQWESIKKIRKEPLKRTGPNDI